MEYGQTETESYMPEDMSELESRDQDCVTNQQRPTPIQGLNGIVDEKSIIVKLSPILPTDHCGPIPPMMFNHDGQNGIWLPVILSLLQRPVSHPLSNESWGFPRLKIIREHVLHVISNRSRRLSMYEIMKWTIC